MKRSRVAKRYAQALFESAQEKKRLDAVEADLKLIDRQYQEDQTFRNLVDSPVIPDHVKLKSFDSAFKSRIDPLTFRLLTILVQKKREAVVADVAADFAEMLDDHRGILRGELQSFQPLSETQQQSLQARLEEMTGKSVMLKEKIDKKLLGGFIVRINDRVYDTSIRNQLNKLRQDLVKS